MKLIKLLCGRNMVNEHYRRWYTLLPLMSYTYAITITIDRFRKLRVGCSLKILLVC
jgi:hypothetical protein